MLCQHLGGTLESHDVHVDRPIDEDKRMALVGSAIAEGLAKLLMHSQGNVHAAQNGMEEADIIKVPYSLPIRDEYI